MQGSSMVQFSLPRSHLHTNSSGGARRRPALGDSRLSLSQEESPMRRKHKSLFLLVATLLLFAGLALVLSSCSKDQGSMGSSPTSSAGSRVAGAALSPRNAADVAVAMRAQNAHTPDLMRIPDVIGTGTGVGQNGRLAVLVLTRRPGVGNIPGTVDGVQTEVRVVGDVVPYGKPGGTLQCGTSTGNNNECAAGTI